jgi:flagellar hook assembly protein FlgD
MVADAAGNEGSGQLNDLKVSEQLILDKVMNYPNPFNQTTNFSYELSREAAVVIRVYTIRGQLVKTLHATAGDSGGQVGFNKVSWNGAAEDGRALPNGMYLYFIEARDSEGRLATARGKAGILR